MYHFPLLFTDSELYWVLAWWLSVGLLFAHIKGSSIYWSGKCSCWDKWGKSLQLCILHYNNLGGKSTGTESRRDVSQVRWVILAEEVVQKTLFAKKKIVWVEKECSFAWLQHSLIKLILNCHKGPRNVQLFTVVLVFTVKITTICLIWTWQKCRKVKTRQVYLESTDSYIQHTSKQNVKELKRWIKIDKDEIKKKMFELMGWQQ